MIPTWVIALVGGLAAAGVTASKGASAPPGLAIAIENIARHAPQNIGIQHALDVLNTLVNGGVGAGVAGGVATVAKSLAKGLGKAK